MSTLEKAIEMAAVAHAGQEDKANAPYILHPLRVMLSMKSRDDQIVAVLHDILEDTPTTRQDLLAAGFSERVVTAIEALTKLDGESRLEAARRTSSNPIATKVKLADVADNMDLSRLQNPTDKDYARLDQYREVKRILEGVLC